MSLDTKEIDASLSSLRLNTTKTKSSSSSPPLADSWEEAASDSESPSQPPSHKRIDSSTLPAPPPPTPISPANGNPFAPPPSTSAGTIAETFSSGGFSTSGSREGIQRTASSDKRQEKTDAVAKRLIAGALGIKAPKKTDEQRAYDRAIREKEMRMRNEEKEARKREEEERERARAAVWED